jgi:hypothetical protein
VGKFLVTIEEGATTTIERVKTEDAGHEYRNCKCGHQKRVHRSGWAPFKSQDVGRIAGDLTVCHAENCDCLEFRPVCPYAVELAWVGDNLHPDADELVEMIGRAAELAFESVGSPAEVAGLAVQIQQRLVTQAGQA